MNKKHLAIVILYYQALWRRVQAGGMVPSYCHDKTFRALIRMIFALPFIEINQLERTIDELRDFPLDKDSPDYEAMEQFKQAFLDYIEDVWIRWDS